MKKAIVLPLLFSVAVFAQQKGSFTDSRDGKRYKTVKIGTQVWMAENVDYAGKKREIGACRDKKPANCKKYGSLYNWEEAIKVCPSGWHLPSNEEWNVLVYFAGGKETAGKKLKAKEGWRKENEGFIPNNGTDDYGFAALPGGFDQDCDINSEPIEFSDVGCWWSATEGIFYESKKGAYHWSIDQDGMDMRVWSKDFDYSVRCIQD
jgi:uncharacterized protein (TIGR02145 family)